MWEVQHLLLDAVVPAAIGATTAGAFYYVTNRIDRRRDEAAMLAISEELKQRRGASTPPARPLKFDPETTLIRLKAYRDRDPRFRQAIAQFVEAEITQTDLVEGVPFEEGVSPQGPVQRKIRGILSA